MKPRKESTYERAFKNAKIYKETRKLKQKAIYLQPKIKI